MCEVQLGVNTTLYRKLDATLKSWAPSMYSLLHLCCYHTLEPPRVLGHLLTFKTALIRLATPCGLPERGGGQINVRQRSLVAFSFQPSNRVLFVLNASVTPPSPVQTPATPSILMALLI